MSNVITDIYPSGVALSAVYFSNYCHQLKQKSLTPVPTYITTVITIFHYHLYFKFSFSFSALKAFGRDQRSATWWETHAEGMRKTCGSHAEDARGEEGKREGEAPS